MEEKGRSEERRVNEVNNAFEIPEGLPRSKEELAERLRSLQPSASRLVFEHEGRLIQVQHEDGCRVSLGQIYYRRGGSFVVGEVLYAHALIQKLDGDPEDFDSQPHETIIPLVVLAIYRDGVLLDRDLKPYVMARKIMLDDAPVLVEARSRLAGTLETLMSLEAACSFVNGASAPSWGEAYAEVRAGLKRFCNLSWDNRLYDVVACWTIASYFQEIFNVLPFLYPYGATGTGKTRLLKTVVYMARHGFLVTDPTEAVLFRTSEALKPTLGIDESLIGSMAWKLIRTAFKKGLYVPRVEETKRNEFVIGLFETFMPVAFSSTEMPKELGGCDADEARAIFIFMQQMPDPIGRDPDAWDFKTIRDKLYLLRLGRANEVLDALKQMEALKLPFAGHEREVWLPLLTIARLVGEDVYSNVYSYAIELYGVKLTQQNQNEKVVVRAILGLFRDKYAEALKLDREAHIASVEFTSTVLQEYVKQVLQGWGEYDEHLFPKQWDNRVIGRILTRLGIFRKLKSGRSHYVVTAKTLQALYARFYGGFGGFGGLKTKVDYPIETHQNNPPETSKQASLTSYSGGLTGGLESAQPTSKFNPPNPPNPPTIDGKTVVGLHWVTSALFPTEKCHLCGAPHVDYQADLTDDSWRLLCLDCGLKLQREMEASQK